jgi:hypothetical protein
VRWGLNQGPRPRRKGVLVRCIDRENISLPKRQSDSHQLHSVKLFRFRLIQVHNLHFIGFCRSVSEFVDRIIMQSVSGSIARLVRVQTVTKRVARTVVSRRARQTSTTRQLSTSCVHAKGDHSFPSHHPLFCDFPPHAQSV